MLDLYKSTRAFPKEELFGLTSQIRRASVSIPANICERCGRGSDADFAKFLYISMGSACEVEYYLTLAEGLGYLDESASKRLASAVIEIKRMLTGLIQRLKPA